MLCTVPGDNLTPQTLHADLLGSRGIETLRLNQKYM